MGPPLIADNENGSVVDLVRGTNTGLPWSDFGFSVTVQCHFQSYKRKVAISLNSFKMKFAALVLGFATGFATAHSKRGSDPCQEIITICRNAGFIEGGWNTGNGINRHCFDPLVKKTKFHQSQPHYHYQWLILL